MQKHNLQPMQCLSNEMNDKVCQIQLLQLECLRQGTRSSQYCPGYWLKTPSFINPSNWAQEENLSRGLR